MHQERLASCHVCFGEGAERFAGNKEPLRFKLQQKVIFPASVHEPHKWGMLGTPSRTGEEFGKPGTHRTGRTGMMGTSSWRLLPKGPTVPDSQPQGQSCGAVVESLYHRHAVRNLTPSVWSKAVLIKWKPNPKAPFNSTH